MGVASTHGLVIAPRVENGADWFSPLPRRCPRNACVQNADARVRPLGESVPRSGVSGHQFDERCYPWLSSAEPSGESEGASHPRKYHSRNR